MGREVAASISIGRVAAKHDMRESIARNVSPGLSKDNVVITDNLHGMGIEEYVNKMMQPYIDEYNAKQRRKDRRIETPYCEWHRNNGNLSQGSGQVAYECVLQYGTREDIGGEYYDPKTSPERKAELRDEMVRVYKQWADDLEKNFPHLKTLYFVIHFDETNGTPHAHWCFAPMGEYDRGLSRQCSIGKALGQDGIERIKDAKQAMDEGGYQLSRFFRKFHHDYQNPTLEKLGYTIKAEVKGRKHEDKSYFADRMADLDERAEKITAGEQRIKEGEQLAIKKMREAALQVLNAKREQEEAAALASLSYKAKEEIDQEIEAKQSRIEELNKKLRNKEDLIQTQDAIDEIFKETGTGVPYPKIIAKRTHGFGKNKMETAEVPVKDLDELRGKAASYELVQMQRKKAEAAAEAALKAADKDETIQELRNENTALKMALQEAKVERNQAEKKTKEMEYDRNEALDYIARNGMGADFVAEYNQQRSQEHHHHR